MGLYEWKANHNGYPHGARVEMDDAEAELWSGEIEAGLIERLSDVVPFLPADDGEGLVAPVRFGE